MKILMIRISREMIWGFVKLVCCAPIMILQNVMKSIDKTVSVLSRCITFSL